MVNEIGLHRQNGVLAQKITAGYSTDGTHGQILTFEEFVQSGAFSFWLERFLDNARVRWLGGVSGELVAAQRTLTAKDHFDEGFVTQSMSSLTDASQSRGWNRQFLDDLCKYKDTYGYVQEPVNTDFHGWSESNTGGTEKPKACINGRHSRILVGRTYLPRLAEAGLAVSLGGFPVRWREPEVKKRLYSQELRNCLNFYPARFTEGTFEHFVCLHLPRYLPMSLVENFDDIQQAVNHRIKKVPDAFFTAHLHLASDSFLIWAAMKRKNGMRLIFSQHGGLYGQGMVPTRDSEFEQRFADHYLHWGWAKSPNAVRIPSQLNLWARRRKKSNKLTQLLLVTDCTFRFSRRPWSNTNENERYRAMLLDTYEALEPQVKAQTLVRLHHHHDVHDDSHEAFWSGRFPEVNLNRGLDPIWKLRQHARLIVCTSLGTSEIEQFGRNMPTILRLDPIVHALRDSCVELFGKMERVGLVHWSTESFSLFMRNHWLDIDGWWESRETQNVVSEYLSTFGYQSDKPLRHLQKILKDVVKAKS